MTSLMRILAIGMLVAGCVDLSSVSGNATDASVAGAPPDAARAINEETMDLGVGVDGQQQGVVCTFDDPGSVFDDCSVVP